MTRRKRAWLATAVALALVLGAGAAAQAHWGARGSGAGSAGSASLQPVSLSAQTAAGSLRPGGSTELRVVATNPNAADVRLAGLVLDTSRGTDGLAVTGAIGSCPVSSFSVRSSAAAWVVPATTRLTYIVPSMVSMAESAPSGCQGASLTVYLRVPA